MGHGAVQGRRRDRDERRGGRPPRLPGPRPIGALAGRRGVHVPTASNPPKDTGVIMYEIDGDELYLYRTGTHDEVYGRKAQ